MHSDLSVSDSSSVLYSTVGLGSSTIGTSNLSPDSGLEGTASLANTSTRNSVGFSSESHSLLNYTSADEDTLTGINQSSANLLDIRAINTGNHRVGASTARVEVDALTGNVASAALVGNSSSDPLTNHRLVTANAPRVGTAADPGSTLATASNLGGGRGSLVGIRREFVDINDTSDVYRCQLTQAGRFNLALHGLTGDADLRLLNSQGNVIASSVADGTQAEWISRNLAAGSYYIEVTAWENASTGYALSYWSGNSRSDPGSALNTASNLGSPGYNQNRYRTEAVSGIDSTDYYRFQLGQNSALDLSLTNLRADADLFVLNSRGSVVARSTNSGLRSETLDLSLDAGVYYVRVNSHRNANTLYTLGLSSTAPSDWFAQNLRDSDVVFQARNLAADSNFSRNDMLSIFRSVQDDSIIDVNEQADLWALVNTNNRFRMSNPVRWLAAQVVEGTSSNMSASLFGSNVGRWFLGTYTPTPQFNEYPLTHVQVQGNLFGPSGLARIGDIDQRDLGDCTFLAALGATFGPQVNGFGNTSSAVVNSMITDNGDGSYAVRFFSNGKAEYETVDRRLAVFNGELFGAQASGSANPNNPNNVLWTPLVTRAYAQWQEWYNGRPGYELIGNGDQIERPLEFVTGRRPSVFNTGEISFGQLQSAFTNNRFISVGRYREPATRDIVGLHAYSITNVYVSSNGQQRVVLRNPWGYDGRAANGNSDDGFINLSFASFRNQLDRVAIA
ncbi:pre-peptidase C-terminal domain-containing protein [Leptolyngbya sp. FACHB-261]|uniref:pre-peptidase C-terminal domain-containing protein n=1 Tax=Leptolyngbya sp. FACHB-261 TaxID=2692806 RepID=UPI001689B4B4|nr:pre-peptidase C-terminal domain-containing protein [Leptolyngbya sp. FACHB-261]MBD2100843.1 pre-peptidase C-terminal domain-containing protein [Leptolyngbya sp. FACHB-261]